jgi:hypothetical protein
VIRSVQIQRDIQSEHNEFCCVRDPAYLHTRAQAQTGPRRKGETVRFLETTNWSRQDHAPKSIQTRTCLSIHIEEGHRLLPDKYKDTDRFGL